MSKPTYREELASKYYTAIMEAIKNKNYSRLEELAEGMGSLAKELAKTEALVESTKSNNFGYLNDLFEASIVSLYKKDRKILREGLKLIKNDKNLSSQFNFYTALKSYNSNDSKSFLKEALSLYNEGVDIKNVKKSNKAFGDFIRKNNLVAEGVVDNETMKMYENCGVLLSSKNTLTNLEMRERHLQEVANYLDTHKKEKVNEGKNIDERIGSFTKKINESLNDNDKNTVSVLIGKDDKSKKSMFESLRREVISEIEKSSKGEALSQESINDLNNLKESIKSMPYNSSSVIKDYSKLLEMYSVLTDDK